MAWDLDEAIAYYKKRGAPSDQTALISLLREIQQENSGTIPLPALVQTARGYGVKDSFLLALVKRIPSLRLQNLHCLEICSGQNCSKQTELAAYVEKTYGKNPTGFTVRYVPCMRLCGKGPNIKWDGTLYHRADADLLRRLLENQKEE
jgi:NADH:ubiquinone oxidoreductase subunit E